MLGNNLIVNAKENIPFAIRLLMVNVPDDDDNVNFYLYFC